MSNIVKLFIKSLSGDGTAVLNQNARGLHPSQSRIEDTNLMYTSIRDFVREERSQKKCVTAAQLLEHLCKQGLFHFTTDDESSVCKEYNLSALRSVQRFLRKK